MRRSLVWPAMILAGLVLGAYVFVAWPEQARTARVTKAEPVRMTASVGAGPESELAGVGVDPRGLFVYELGPTPLLDAVIAAPQTVDAH